MSRRLSPEERKKYINLRRSFKSPVIGITGNIGKTTTLEMIRSVLERDGHVLNSNSDHGSWKHNIDTLEKFSEEYNYALFEFGFSRGNHFGEILNLIKPNIGIITNFGDAHLSYLGNMIEIALQKSEVVKYLARNGVAILNKDDELSSSIEKHIKTDNIIKFGLSDSADYYATDIQHLGAAGTSLILNNKYSITLPVYSISDVYNFLAATAALVALQFSIDLIVDTLQNHFQLPDGRGRLHKIKDIYLIDESYNATPRSVAKAVRAIIGFKPTTKKLIYIIGDMIESGPNIEEEHLHMGYFISALPIDCLITVGNYAEYIGKGISLIQCEDKVVKSCNSIDEILLVLDQVIANDTAITIQGIGTVAMKRIITFLEKK
jgi:UDP-N-acetylmuramoyl-tripeptide--D-alanyl-D-alanine ligase